MSEEKLSFTSITALQNFTWLFSLPIFLIIVWGWVLWGGFGKKVGVSMVSHVWTGGGIVSPKHRIPKVLGAQCIPTGETWDYSVHRHVSRNLIITPNMILKILT